ncbi:hypothetical protein GQR58_020148 [Nymphon striatum]|nr:hypothetical protein GQR58_020148 [Nymphon striatum]
MADSTPYASNPINGCNEKKSRAVTRSHCPRFTKYLLSPTYIRMLDHIFKSSTSNHTNNLREERCNNESSLSKTKCKISTDELLKPKGVFFMKKIMDWKDKIFTKNYMNTDISICMEAVDISDSQSAECERVFSNMKLVKSDWRSVLKSKNLSDQLMVILATNDIDQYDPLPAIRLWNSAGSKPRREDTNNVVPGRRENVLVRSDYNVPLLTEQPTTNYMHIQRGFGGTTDAQTRRIVRGEETVYCAAVITGSLTNQSRNSSPGNAYRTPQKKCPRPIIKHRNLSSKQKEIYSKDYLKPHSESSTAEGSSLDTMKP